MERIKFVLRLVGIFFSPVAIGILSAIIWQNNHIFIDKFFLVGSWWILENLRLSSVLAWFAVLGFGLALIWVLLFRSEHKLRDELVEMRRLIKEPATKPDKKMAKEDPKAQPSVDTAELVPAQSPSAIDGNPS